MTNNNFLLKLKNIYIGYITYSGYISQGQISTILILYRLMMMNLRFKTKAGLLKRLGKDSKDVRLVDRMLKRGKISKEGDEYVLGMSTEVMALINFILGMCEDEDEKEGMLKRIYDVLYNK